MKNSIFFMKEEVLLMKKAKEEKLKENMNNVERRCMVNICKYYDIENSKIDKVINMFLHHNKDK